MTLQAGRHRLLSIFGSMREVAEAEQVERRAAEEGAAMVIQVCMAGSSRCAWQAVSMRGLVLGGDEVPFPALTAHPLSGCSLHQGACKGIPGHGWACKGIRGHGGACKGIPGQGWA